MFFTDHEGLAVFSQAQTGLLIRSIVYCEPLYWRVLPLRIPLIHNWVKYIHEYANLKSVKLMSDDRPYKAYKFIPLLLYCFWAAAPKKAMSCGLQKKSVRTSIYLTTCLFIYQSIYLTILLWFSQLPKALGRRTVRQTDKQTDRHTHRFPCFLQDIAPFETTAIAILMGRARVPLIIYRLWVTGWSSLYKISIPSRL